MDELPYKFLENQGFRSFCHLMQPQFQVPSRITVARDCLQLFLIENEKLKSILPCNSQMISITIDTLTSIQNLSYMCVTGHYIDDNWIFNKKILGFFLIANHRQVFEEMLERLGHLKNCMCNC